jgi:hypothetical protein
MSTGIRMAIVTPAARIGRYAGAATPSPKRPTLRRKPCKLPARTQTMQPGLINR